MTQKGRKEGNILFNDAHNTYYPIILLHVVVYILAHNKFVQSIGSKKKYVKFCMRVCVCVCVCVCNPFKCQQ